MAKITGKICLRLFTIQKQIQRSIKPNKVYQIHGGIFIMNKTYCPAAFREIYVDGSGQYKLCCYQGKNPDLAKYKDDKTLPFEYFMSKELENIRNAMYEGKPVKGCELCYQQEERVGKSYRTERYLKKYHFADTVGDVQLKLRINGSYCNLGC